MLIIIKDNNNFEKKKQVFSSVNIINKNKKNLQKKKN